MNLSFLSTFFPIQLMLIAFDRRRQKYIFFLNEMSFAYWFETLLKDEKYKKPNCNDIYKFFFELMKLKYLSKRNRQFICKKFVSTWFLMRFWVFRSFVVHRIRVRCTHIYLKFLCQKMYMKRSKQMKSFKFDACILLFVLKCLENFVKDYSIFSLDFFL